MAPEETAVVFGGSGFIGRHLLRALVAEGHRVYSADLRPLSPHVPGVEATICDVRQSIAKTVAPNIVGRCTVYNLAAVHRTPGHPDREYYDTNIGGALNVTDFCRSNEIKRLLFTSSIAVYGPDETAKDESAEPAPESAYGASKLHAEAIHHLWVRENASRRLVIVRPAVIFGAGEEGNFSRLAHALRTRRFVYPGRKNTIKACGYVDELIRSIKFMFGRDEHAVTYNFCYPERYSIEDICNAFHDVAGLPLPLAQLPYGAMRAAAIGFEGLSRVGVKTGIRRERIEKLVRSTNIVPKYLASAGYEFETDLVSALAAWRDATDGRFV